MKLSMQILKDWLEEFSPVLHCKSSKIDITGTRLYQPGIQMKDYAVYIGTSDAFFQDGKQNIVCKNRSDTITLDTDDLFTVANHIQDAFSFYLRWHNRCTQAIADGCSLSDLLTLAADVFHMRIIINNAAQFMVAHTPSLDAVVFPEDWKNVAENRSLPEERLKQFNQVYKDSFYETGVFMIPGGFSPTKAYCKHIMDNEERLATIILKPLEHDCTPGMLHLLELFSSLVLEWIQATDENAVAFRLTSYFARTLDGQPGTLPIMLRQLSLFGWEDDCRKQVFMINSQDSAVHLDVHSSQRLADEGLGVYVIPYHEKLVLLCNLDMVEYNHFAENLCEIMKRNNYCGASSFPFTSLDQFRHSYNQALTALDHSPRAPGKLYRCQDVAMRVVAKIVDDYTFATLLHPALAAIKTHDQQHKTEYYHTLFCFLKNERHHRLTAEELFIHRNTLFLRLEKIQELWPLDLDDAEERFYLLFSFYQDQYAAQTDNSVLRSFNRSASGSRAFFAAARSTRQQQRG